MLLLDTHVLVWLDEGNPRLGSTALIAINEALAAGQLALATISFWEIMLRAHLRLHSFAGCDQPYRAPHENHRFS